MLIVIRMPMRAAECRSSSPSKISTRFKTFPAHTVQLKQSRTTFMKRQQTLFTAELFQAVQRVLLLAEACQRLRYSNLFFTLKQQECLNNIVR